MNDTLERLKAALADGGEPVQLTTDPSSDFAPRWSRDGRAIAFHSLRHGNRDILTINPDGTGERRRTTSPAEEPDVGWAPDGTALVHQTFTAHVNTSQVVTLADGSERDLWPGEYARWSPRGDEILIISAPGLVVGPAAGATPRVLVGRTDPMSGPYLATWSPDARGRHQIRVQTLIHVEDSFVLGEVAPLVALRQHPPRFGWQAQRVRQRLEDDVAVVGAVSSVAQRRQGQSMGGAVGEVEPSLERQRRVRGIRQPREPGTQEALELTSRAGPALELADPDEILELRRRHRPSR